MPWTQAQRKRLAAEKSVLEHYFPGCVKWIDPTGDTKVEVTLMTNNDNEYTLRVYVENFPNAVHQTWSWSVRQNRCLTGTTVLPVMP